MPLVDIPSIITGTVWKVEAPPGTRVAAGDAVIIVESMKMEVPLVAEHAGTVAEVRVAAGDAVAEGQVVAVVET